MRFDVVTLFPDLFSGYLSQSILSKAIEERHVRVDLHDLRDWTKDKHRAVDDRPFGGGPGMVIKVEPVVECVETIQPLGDQEGHIVLLTPQGRRLNQHVVEELAGKQRSILLCGRYEGFDHRVIEVLQPDEISIGDYVLNGGEVAAMVVIDAVLRLVPGVLGDERSHHFDSFSSQHRILEYPQYTRPREFRGLSVPDVLLSGDHERIANWRRRQSYENTRRRRSDLLKKLPPEEDDHTTQRRD